MYAFYVAGIIYISCVVTSEPVQTLAVSQFSDRQENPDFLHGNRKRRGIVNMGMKGMEAVKRLLTGATPIPSKDKSTRVFLKKGSYKTALNDFQDMRPKDIRPFKVGRNQGMFGDLGDRIVMVENRGRKGKPTMRIMRNMGTAREAADEIIYVTEDVSKTRTRS